MVDYENIQRYLPGGFHPVLLGDTFNNHRYVVEHKLGHGGSSTVWLARDIRLKRLVALKIFASIPECVEKASNESSILRQLQPHPQPRKWSWLSPLTWISTPRVRIEFCPILYDEFTIDGPNGAHRCIVMEPLGPTLDKFLADDMYDGGLPIKTARKVGLQLAQAISEMHACGIVHGDLHPGNIVLCIPGLASWTVDTIYEYIGQPEKLAVRDLCSQRRLEPRIDSEHLPEYLVRCPPLSLAIQTLCLEFATAKIIDFDMSFHYSAASGGVQKLIKSPAQFAAPEVQLQDIITPACDVWAFACLLYHIFTGCFLFLPLPYERQCLVDLTICFGRLPDRWWGMWKSRSDYYHENGQVKRGDKVPTVRGNFETRIRKWNYGGMKTDEHSWFLRLLREVCKLDPKERLMSVEVLRYLPAEWWEDGESNENSRGVERFAVESYIRYR